MERFVQLIVAGGLALVAGLWIAALRPWASPSWLLAVAVAVAGVAALGAGIHSEIES